MSTYSSNLVAETFVKQYYDMMARNPQELHRFYTEESQFCHAEDPNEDSATVKGVTAIRKRVGELNLLSSQVDLSEGAYDVQESFANVSAILVVVTGHFSKKDCAASPFTHTFVLAKPEMSSGGGSYYVHNSIFRLQNPPARPTEEAAAPVALVDEEAVAAPPAVIKEEVTAKPAKAAKPAAAAPAPVVMEEEEVKEAPSLAVPVLAAEPEPVVVAAPAPAPKGKVEPVAAATTAAVKKEEPAKPSAKLSFADMAKRASTDGETVLRATPTKRPTPTTKPKVTLEKKAVATSKSESSGAGSGGNKKKDDSDIQNDNRHHSMYIKQVKPECTEAELRETFGMFGGINRCDVQGIKGFAFIDFNSRAALDAALTCKEPLTCCGSQLKVEERTPKPPFNNNGGAAGSKGGAGNKQGGQAKSSGGGKTGSGDGNKGSNKREGRDGEKSKSRSGSSGGDNASKPKATVVADKEK